MPHLEQWEFEDLEGWEGFKGRIWKEEINVRDFIQKNYEPYDGDESFLEPATEATNKLWGALQKLQKEERAKGGVLECETEVVSGLTSYGPGYIDEELKDLEQVVGLQTDKPLKRAFMPYGGIRMAISAAETYGYEINPQLKKIFTEYVTTHNDAVFGAYTSNMKLARKTHVVTGLPDTYGRGRIVGDYRRVALYGIDRLIFVKELDRYLCGCGNMYDDVIRQREEIAMQIKALKEMKEMAKVYGYDISKPAKTAKEAVQWLYFGYLAAIKTQNGAAMSVGRISTFLDIYIQRDLKAGILTESEAQELIDHITMKFRMVKFARIPSYNQLFSGDPTWATLEVAGTGLDGRSMVTKTDYRFLHTLENMGPSPEPNMTVLYSSRLPETFKRYAAQISIDTSSIQYENDDVMKPEWGDDYSICCCVSATKTGKEIQLFGARANLAKTLLYAFNGGFDEKHRIQCGPKMAPITSEYADYDEVIEKFDAWMEWLADIYVNVLNLIHYMHDKYYYEAAEMALIDSNIERSFATGIAGFSHVVDSLSAIKYAKVKIIRDEEGITKDFEIEGDFPRYGNDDDRVDAIATWLLRCFFDKIKRRHTYRDSKPSTSILTITSNVVYGEATGATPDGRKAFTSFAPGGSPSYGAEQNGLLASLNSVAKLPYHWAL
ncbi:MAG: formate acetyltransferase, partial [Clostridiales bacterium]|nr:formate acetyltransferase [Candidatus Blautia equi]